MTNRRYFILGAAVPAIAKRLSGANDRINVAVVGVRGRGKTHIDCFSRHPGAKVTMICDIDSSVAAAGQSRAEKLQGSRPEVCQDIRRVLDNRDVDVVSLATPNHWHALGTIWACQAGKDVFVEKPASHNIWEGQRMVDAARKYKRMVQVGMQAHSLEHYNRAIQLVREGAIGKVYMAKGLCYKRRKSIGHQPDGPVPPGVDYNLWVGPASMRPFNPNRFHYNWHWFWDTGNGDIGNQGIHEMDIARWGLNRPGIPTNAYSTGSKYIYQDDDQETPNTQLAILRYPDTSQIVFEVRGLMTQGEGDMNLEGPNYIGVMFLGSEGTLTLDSGGFKVFIGDNRRLTEQMKYVESDAWATAPHVANFLKAVRSRRWEDLTCDIEEAYRSVLLVHMANISYRTQRPLVFDPAALNFGSDQGANQLVSRRYRAPFVVPERV